MILETDKFDFQKTFHVFYSNIKKFQILGFDIMFDENLKAWLLELNSYPSLSMYSEIDTPTGEYVKTVSELDKYVKFIVIQDAIKLARKSSKVNGNKKLNKNICRVLRKFKIVEVMKEFFLQAMIITKSIISKIEILGCHFWWKGGKFSSI